MSNQNSRWACIFSVRWLFRDVSLRDLADPPPPREAYLWTFTFAYEWERLDPKFAALCWSAFANDKRMRGRVYVHSFEAAPSTGYWHFHAVTPDWWDVNEIREISTHHGFGRIDVKAVPVSKAEYVAKYVAKRVDGLPSGARRWACHGFKGVRAVDVTVSKCVDTLPQDDIHSAQLWDGWLWRLGDNSTITVLTRHDADPENLQLKTMELKPFAQKEILSLIAQGKCIAVGEYRSCQVRSQKVANKTTHQFEDRLIVEHTVEFGANAVKIAEWLPQGASKDVKPPAAKGELVMCVVTEISRQYGYKVESLRPVSAIV